MTIGLPSFEDDPRASAHEGREPHRVPVGQNDVVVTSICAFFKCPDQGADISTALDDCLHAIERQLNMNPGDLTIYADQPKEFKERACPRIRQLLSIHAILIVIDNMESLLTDSGKWRDEKWKDFINTLLSHTGTSRTVLTSRSSSVSTFSSWL